MKRFMLFFTLVMASLSFMAANAEAKRMGGGSNVGKQRDVSPQQTQRSTSAAPAQATPQQAAPQQSSGNKWLGPLAGLAIGAGLGALFAGSGLSGLGTILMIVLAVIAVVVAVSMYRRSQAAPKYAGAGAPYNPPQPAWQPTAAAAQPVAQPVTSPSNIPADFPQEAFIRSAKTTFIRLQAANDRKDLDDIREYTTPEMFAEISMQMQERGDAPQKTVVQNLDANLLEVVMEGDYAIASVRFTAQLSENGAQESVDEIWHVQKDLRNDKAVWLLVGIQQTPLQ